MLHLWGKTEEICDKIKGPVVDMPTCWSAFCCLSAYFICLLLICLFACLLFILLSAHIPHLKKNLLFLL